MRIRIGVPPIEVEPCAIGVGWAKADGSWQYLAQFGEGSNDGM